MGVHVKSGKVIKAKKAVVPNATPCDTVGRLPDGGDAPELPEGVREWKKTLGKLPRHGAIMHLIVAIDAADDNISHIKAPTPPAVQEWDSALQAAQKRRPRSNHTRGDPAAAPPGTRGTQDHSPGRHARQRSQRAAEGREGEGL